MSVRLLPWAPEYGTSLQAAVDDATPQLEVDAAVEQQAWTAVAPAAAAPGAVQIVDGVRRAEAHALADGLAGEPLFGLFGSYAVGAVRCGLEGARILEETIDVQRRYFQAGGDPLDRAVAAGAHVLTFRAESRSEATTANGLIDALNRVMLDAESRLTEALSRDESALTLVDGPLRGLRAPGRRVVGYVKRVVHWYVSPEQQRLLPLLDVGQRTPLFRLGDPSDPAAPGRYCWYLRIAQLGGHFHPLGGVMRLEVPATLPLTTAVELADQAAQALPPLASSPARDPRAPQNLTPVGALEERLTHRLGDRVWVRRLLTASLASELPAVAGTLEARP